MKFYLTIFITLLTANAGFAKLPTCPQDKFFKTWDGCFGSLVVDDRSEYVGEWQNGKPHGFGQ